MVGDQRVLVIDGLSETEDVLRAVLEPRGLRVDSIRGARNEQTPTRAGAPSRPDVLVVHEDEYVGESRDGNWAGVPRVIIGTARIPESKSSSGDRYLQQPFQYGDLIRAIDGFLAEKNTPVGRPATR